MEDVSLVMIVSGSLVYGLLLFGIMIVFKQFPRAALLAMCIVPVAGAWFWVSSSFYADWFLRVKLYSVIAGVIWFHLLACTALRDKPWACWLVLVILWGNILEAVWHDALHGHLVNAMAGLLLVAGSWPRTIGQVISFSGRNHALVWQTSRLWIVAYTVWNMAFVYMNYDRYFIPAGIIILVLPLVAGLVNPGQWLYARAVILCVHFVVFYTNDLIIAGLFVDGLYQPPVAYALQGLALLLCLWGLSRAPWWPAEKPGMATGA